MINHANILMTASAYATAGAPPLQTTAVMANVLLTGQPCHFPFYTLYNGFIITNYTNFNLIAFAYMTPGPQLQTTAVTLSYGSVTPVGASH